VDTAAPNAGVIVLDTSVLVDALTGPRRSGRALRATIEAGERVVLTTLGLYEWLRGPRERRDLAVQESLLPAASAIPFGPEESRAAAALYRRVPRGRGREFDLGIAACALTHAAALWTLDVNDFRDIPGLMLYTPPGVHRERP
jgi:predicted nucleic acid-binding protein